MAVGGLKLAKVYDPIPVVERLADKLRISAFVKRTGPEYVMYVAFVAVPMVVGGILLAAASKRTGTTARNKRNAGFDGDRGVEIAAGGKENPGAIVQRAAGGDRAAAALAIRCAQRRVRSESATDCAAGRAFAGAHRRQGLARRSFSAS